MRAYQLLTTHYTLPTEQLALVYVGNGHLRSDIERYTKEHNLKNVHITGFINQGELPKYYAMADVFVLPSEAGETWGLVVNEAMCSRVPIIVSDISGCAPDVVREGENGYTFSLGNIEELAKHLEDLFSHPDKRKAFGEKSLEIVKCYDFNENIRGIIKALSYLRTRSVKT